MDKGREDACSSSVIEILPYDYFLFSLPTQPRLAFPWEIFHVRPACEQKKATKSKTKRNALLHQKRGGEHADVSLRPVEFKEKTIRLPPCVN